MPRASLRTCPHCGGDLIQKTAKAEPAPRPRFNVGQGGFVMPKQGRPAYGSLPGESTEDRDRRVLAHIREHPKATTREVCRALGVPEGLVKRMAHMAKREDPAQTQAAVERQFKPTQKFVPSKPLPATAAERLAATSDAVKAEIAARYGVKVR